MINSIHHPHFNPRFIPSEMLRLHASQTLSTLGGSLVGIFIPIYLLSLEYTLIQVATFYLIREGFGPLSDFMSGQLTARFGPKHIMRLSFLFKIVFFVTLFILPDNASLFYPLAIIYQIQGMHGVAYLTEFSKLSDDKTGKVKSHEGKQLGRAFIFSRMAAALGPLIGGYIITNYSIKVNFILAIFFIFTAGAVLAGKEPVRTHQKTKVGKLHYKDIKPDFFGILGISFEYSVRSELYGIFLSMFVLTKATQFSGLGLISTISIFISILAALWIGRLSDRGKSWRVLRYSAIKSALINVGRGFFVTPVGSGAINALNDSAAVGIRIPLYKGFYGSVNKLEGFRISYWVKIFLVVGMARTSFWLIFIILLQLFDDKLSMQIMFMLTALMTLVLLKTKPLYE